jgi:oligoendopeptidase F
LNIRRRKIIMNWDLNTYFSEFNGPEMKTFKESVDNDISKYLEKASSLEALDKENADKWEEIFIKSEDISARLSHLGSYIGCLSAADARNEEYLKEEANMALFWAKFSKLDIEMLRAIKKAPKNVMKSFIDRKIFTGIQYFLERMYEESKRTMTPEKERLSTDLGVDGISAWGRLYDSISGKLEFDMEFPGGEKKRLPISQRRTFLEDPDRKVRSAAFLGGNKAWESVETAAAAALNAISGTRLTLNKHRGIDHFLEVALFQSGVSRKTLDAMFEAIKENIEIPRNILRLKAKSMGLKKISWYDLGAPMKMESQERFSWDDGKEMIRTSFNRAYPALGDFLKSCVYDKNWVDWEARTGKRPGGFCTGSLLTKESRIFMTYNGSMGDIRTLAHEAGHAFHSFVMKDLRPFAHIYPMPLAETASTFAEMILTEGLLQDPEISAELKKFILDQELGHAAIYLLDINVRFNFEKMLYEERSKGELSISRFKEIMIRTQRDVFGDTLEEGGEDPMFWASKLHFYITEVTFYNFPYTFGFLLSRGLYSMFKKEGADFLPRYEKFLKFTGSASCEKVADRSLGRDISTPEFWKEAIISLKPLQEQLAELMIK